MKSILVPFLLLAALSGCSAPSHDSFNIASIESPGTLETITLDSAHVEISLPRAWQRKPEVYEKPGLTMYHFRRQAVYDAAARRIIPNLAVFAERVPRGVDLVEYSVTKRTQSIYRDMYAFELERATPGNPGSLCYLAQYDDPSGIAHKVYLVHSLVEGKGIQIIIDGTESVFDMLDPEYRLILGRLRFVQ
jgi:hypothetical protein